MSACLTAAAHGQQLAFPPSTQVAYQPLQHPRFFPLPAACFDWSCLACVPPQSSSRTWTSRQGRSWRMAWHPKPPQQAAAGAPRAAPPAAGQGACSRLGSSSGSSSGVRHCCDQHPHQRNMCSSRMQRWLRRCGSAGRSSSCCGRGCCPARQPTAGTCLPIKQLRSGHQAAGNGAAAAGAQQPSAGPFNWPSVWVGMPPSSRLCLGCCKPRSHWLLDLYHPLSTFVRDSIQIVPALALSGSARAFHLLCVRDDLQQPAWAGM